MGVLRESFGEVEAGGEPAIKVVEGCIKVVDGYCERNVEMADELEADVEVLYKQTQAELAGDVSHWKKTLLGGLVELLYGTVYSQVQVLHKVAGLAEESLFELYDVSEFLNEAILLSASPESNLMNAYTQGRAAIDIFMKCVYGGEDNSGAKKGIEAVNAVRWMLIKTLQTHINTATSMGGEELSGYLGEVRELMKKYQPVNERLNSQVSGVTDHCGNAVIQFGEKVDEAIGGDHIKLPVPSEDI